MMDTKHLFRVSLFPLLLLPVVTPAQSIPEPLGTYYATNHGSPYSYPTGINASIMLCGTTNPCTVIVPAGYGYEPVPGSNPDPGYAQPNSAGFGTPGSVPSNVTIIDQRGGGATTLQNNENYSYSNAATGSLLNCSHTSTVPSTNGNSVYCFDILQSPNAGGTNYNYNTSLLDLGYSTTNWQALQTTVFASTKGQAIASGVASVHNGVGDTLGMSVSAHCHGGFVSYSDEGCEGMDLQVYQAGANGTPQDYMGMISAGVTGVTTVTISNTQGEGSQGEGRYLLLTQGVSPSSSVISHEGAPSSASPMSYTITGSSTLPVSTTVATLNGRHSRWPVNDYTAVSSWQYFLH